MRLERYLSRIAIFLLLSASAVAQPNAVKAGFGDSTVVAAIDSRLRAMYDAQRFGPGRITRENLLGLPGSFGTEVGTSLVDGRLTRVMASTWTPDGKYGSEFWFAAGGDTLLFVFETFEYADEAQVATTARNFRGIRSWQRRSYFRGDSLAFAETVGDGGPTPGSHGALLSQRARVLREAVLPLLRRSP